MNAIAYYSAYRNGANAREMIAKLGLDELNKNASEDYIPLSVEEFEKKADMEKFEGSITDALGGLGDVFRTNPPLMWGLGGAGLGALLSDNPLWGATLGGLAGWGGYNMFGKPGQSIEDTVTGIKRNVGDFTSDPAGSIVKWRLKKMVTNKLKNPFPFYRTGVRVLGNATGYPDLPERVDKKIDNFPALLGL